ncbi:MAG: ArsR family transcriptional regulator, partial [Ornithinimicrobium sp.]
LRECGLVTARPHGRATVYSLNHPEALMDLWAAAERLLEATGDAVTLCPNHGIHALPRPR